MANFKFKGVSIRETVNWEGECRGWVIQGENPPKQYPVIVSIGAVVGQELAYEIADNLAKKLSGKDKAERLRKQ